jgi:N-acetylmuramoyl-L-alanine amidase
LITVCLDAGHGEDARTSGVYDSGAEGARGLEEAELAFQLVESALFVAKTEFADTIKCVLTRDSRTESAPTSLRTAEAYREGADCLISVHLNSASPAATGVEVYHRDGDAGDMILANIVQRAMCLAFDLRDRGIKAASTTRHRRLAVLEGATRSKPGALAEFGFITNSGDMAAIFGDGSRDRRIECWRLIFAGILRMDK